MAADLPRSEGTVFHVIKPHEPDAGWYDWLHGVALAWHKGRLYASLGHNEATENTITEEAPWRASDDGGGRIWSPVRPIAAGDEEELAAGRSRRNRASCNRAVYVLARCRMAWACPLDAMLLSHRNPLRGISRPHPRPGHARANEFLYWAWRDDRIRSNCHVVAEMK